MLVSLNVLDMTLVPVFTQIAGVVFHGHIAASIVETDETEVNRRLFFLRAGPPVMKIVIAHVVGAVAAL
jgi:hypothetical protein